MSVRLTRGMAAAAAGVLCAALAGTAQADEFTVEYTGQGHAYNPVFSLDGGNVAFEVNRFSGDIELFFAALKGTLSAAPGKKVLLPGTRSPLNSESVVVNPTWHPEGIAVFEGSNEGGKYRLYFAQPSGASAAEMLTKSLAPGDLTFPAISPSGDVLAFISDQTGNGDIRTWHRSTGAIAQVTKTPGAEMFPQFHSSGTKILFTRKMNGAEDVFEVDLKDVGPDGMPRARPIVGGTGDQTRPNYAGDRIVLFSQPPDTASDKARDKDLWDLISVDRDGGDKKMLAKSVKLPLRARPAVTPDGEWVAFTYNDPQKSNSVWLVRTADPSAKVEIAYLDRDPPPEPGKPQTYHPRYRACDEPALTVKGGKVMLAFTALPPSGSDWRFLVIDDITDKLSGF